MEHISKHIARKLLDNLPGDEKYYKLSDLREMGFPGFVVKRIQVEMERNLAESIVPPQTDWANMDSSAVQAAWNQFIAAIRAEALLPASFTLSVVETAVNDIIEMLVQPRKNLPDIIFGADEVLSYNEVVRRADVIVVYRHFASLIPRYMEKKNLAELTKERCSKIIADVDEKLTAHYTPLNWAQMLEPLFTLLDEQIDSDMLRLFFEDKKMPRFARSFDLMNRSLNRAQLIEVLSSPELLNLEGYEEEQSDLFETGSEKTKINLDELARQVARDAAGPEGKEQDAGEGAGEDARPADDGRDQSESAAGDTEADTDTDTDTTGDKQQPQEEGEKEDVEAESNPIISGFLQRRQKERDHIENKESSLNTVFFSEEDEDVVEASHREDIADEDTLNAAFTEESAEDSGTEKDRDKQQAAPKQKKPAAKKKQGTEGDKPETVSDIASFGPETGKGGQKETESTPMWERFMSPEDKAEMLRREQQEQEANPAEEYEEEPIIDLTKKEGPDEEAVQRLNRLLEDERGRFVEEIFKGGDEAYDDAIREIADKEDWRSASRYIDKEIFKRNLVDMYSEVAVDFTDRLQSYFIEASKSSN